MEAISRCGRQAVRRDVGCAVWKAPDSVARSCYLQPGEVINARTGHYGYVEVGRYPAGTDLLCATLAEDLAAAGFAAAVNPTVMRAKGAKCLGNLANAVTAITGSHRGADAFMAHARDEARRVWRAAGIDFEESDEFAARRGPRYRGSDR